MPDGIKKIVSPFFGGGSVEIACAKELANRLKKFEPTKEEYKRVKNIMKQHWNGKKIIIDRCDLAAIYYFNHNTSYGPHFLGSPSSVYLQKERYEKMVKKVGNFDVKNIEVKCNSFEYIIEQHKNDFLYLDPPYYLGGDSKTFVGMYPHRNFPIHHNGFKHKLLSEMLRRHKGGFILSYNDCTAVREMYKGFKMLTPSWQYTFSQGDTRIGENRLKDNNGSYIKKSHELIICNIGR